MKLVFGGTAEFAVPSLNALVEAGHQVVLVVSQPDRPTGRGRALHPSPVKQAALDLGIPLFQPEKLQAQEFADRLLAVGEIDAAVVVAYGQKIPKVMLDWPRLGVVNVHGSLLPSYRGAAPIQRAVMNGDKSTGVTTMLMDEGWDTGDILLQTQLPIQPDETAGELSQRLAQIGARLLIETLAGLQDGSAQPRKQDDSEATFAPSLKREEGFVDWFWPVDRVANTIRGCTPSPGAFSLLGSTRVKLWRAVSVRCPANGEPGEVVGVDKEGILVAAGEECVRVLELQAEGRKRVSGAEFARGFAGLVGKTFRSLSPDA